MRTVTATILGAAALAGSATLAAAAGTYGTPLVDRNTPLSVQVEHVMSSMLAPLDALTRPVNTLVSPVVGKAGFTPVPTSDLPKAAGPNTAPVQPALVLQPPAAR